MSEKIKPNKESSQPIEKPDEKTKKSPEQEKSPEQKMEEYYKEADKLFTEDGYFKKKEIKLTNGKTVIMYSSPDSDTTGFHKTEKGLFSSHQPVVVSDAWGKTLFQRFNFNESTPFSINDLKRFLLAVKEYRTSWEERHKAEALEKTLDKPKPKQKLPDMESFKSNVAPGKYLVEVLKGKGLKVRHSTADRSQGFTGSLEIENPEDAVTKSVIDKLNNTEIVKGYKIVILPVNEGSYRYSTYEFIKI